jgi:thymidylate kinase
MNSKNKVEPTKIIYVMGIDGSGKSTIAEHLANKYREDGFDVDILWLRFNHVITKPLLAFCRLVGLTKYETVNGIRVGYHNFHKSSIISTLFVFFQYLDAKRVKYTKIMPRIKAGNQVLILDRYIYDILIDVAVDTGDEDIFKTRMADRFRNLLPENTIAILVQRDLKDVLVFRPEGEVDRNFESRYRYFQKLENESGIHTIMNDKSLDDLLNEAEKLVGLQS